MLRACSWAVVAFEEDEEAWRSSVRARAVQSASQRERSRRALRRVVATWCSGRVVAVIGEGGEDEEAVVVGVGAVGEAGVREAWMWARRELSSTWDLGLGGFRVSGASSFFFWEGNER